MDNVVLYCRVSTDEQAERGYSIRDQKEKLERYAGIKNYSVINCIEEDHSAKTFNRPEFQKFLSVVKKNKGVIKRFIFIRWDRFSRNLTEALLMIRTLKELGVECEAMEQPLDMSIPENMLMLAIFLATPQIENERRARNITAGIRRAHKEGRYCSPAPFGYKYGRDEHNRPILIPDSNKAQLIHEAFTLYASGLHEKEGIRRMLKPKGLTLERTRFGLVFHNPLYIGKIFVKGENQEPDRIIQGIHQPLISEDLFNKVQILSGRVKVQQSIKHTAKEELPLRGFLQCPECGSNLTGSASRSRNKTRHYYYHCHTPCKVRFKANLVHERFENWLESIALKPEYRDEYLTMVETIYKREEGDRKQELERIKIQLAENESMHLKVDMMLVDEKLERDSYTRLKEKYQKERLLLQSKQEALKEVDADLLKQIEFAFSILSNLREMWQELDLVGKQKLIGSIFGEKIVFDGEICRTANLVSSVTDIFNIDGPSDGDKKEKTAGGGGLSRLVELRGVEPLSGAGICCAFYMLIGSYFRVLLGLPIAITLP